MSAYEEITELVSAGRVEEAASRINKLPPHEVVEVLLRLSNEYRRRLLVPLDLERMVDELAKLPPELVLDVVSSKGIDDIVRAVEKLPVDEAADFLSKVPPKMRLDVLGSLPKEWAKAIASLMKFPPETVGGVMTTMVPVYARDLTVGEALDDYTHKVKLGLYESSHFFYVIDSDRRLVGCVELRALLTKPRDVKLSKCVVPVRVHVTPLDDREKAAKVALTHDLLEVPVVDYDGRFLGIVTLDDLLDVLMSECSEDLLRYAGFAEVVKGSYITESPLKLALKRAPVLLLLYLANTITGVSSLHSRGSLKG